MIIEASSVRASSARSYQKVEAQSMTVDLWGGATAVALSSERVAVQTEFSQTAQLMLEQQNGQPTQRLQPGNQGVSGRGAVATSDGLPVPQNKAELKLRMLDDFLHRLTGRRLNPRLFEAYGLRRPSLRDGLQSMRLAQNVGRGTAGAQLTYQNLSYERETVAYNATGVVKTADGKSISVDVSLAMSREFMEYSQANLSFRPASLVDPLVINYGGTAASLTNEKFAFDLDADGVMDQISFAGAGSGFLALDKNGDGTINDGSELFGPSTGQGFEELRAYDKDGNGWIDESDEIFSQLRIWCKDASGKDQLFTLKDLDVGAIYLGDVATEFSLTDGTNNANGVMRSTSFFLKESGGAGTVSHIDLVV